MVFYLPKPQSSGFQSVVTAFVALVTNMVAHVVQLDQRLAQIRVVLVQNQYQVLLLLQVLRLVEIVPRLHL